MTEVDPQYYLSILNDVEQLFKEQLGLYLLIAKSNELTIKIDIELEPIFQQITLHCKVNKKTANQINYNYHFVINEQSMSFIELYYFYYSTYITYFKEEEPNFIEVFIIPKIFDEIKKNPLISSEIQQLEIYDSRHSDKFKEYESETLRTIKSIGKDIKFVTKTIYDLSEKTKAIFEFLLTSIEKNNKYLNININIDEFLTHSQRKNIFELYYKRIVCDDLYATYKGYGKHALFFNWDYYRDLLLHYEDISLPNAISYSGFMSFGDYLPYFFMNDKISFQKYYDAIQSTPSLPSSPKIFTPYYINDPNKFSFINLSRDEKQNLLITPYGSKKQINSMARFYKHYATGVLKKQNEYKKILKIIKNFPRVFFHSDTFGIISLEIPSQKSLEGNRITLRLYIYNLTTQEIPNGLFHYYRSFKMDKEEDKFFSTLKQGTAIFEKLFNFYPFHPFFFNRMNYHMVLYSAKLLKIDNILHGDRLGYNVDPLINDLFFQMELPSSIDLDLVSTSLNSIKKNLLKEIIAKFIDDSAYLWVLTYIEKYLYLLALLENKLPKNERDFEGISDRFFSFIVAIQDSLERAINGHKDFRLIVGLPKLKDNLIADIYFPRTLGLYYCLNYNKVNRRLKIFKLNSISFNPIELHLIKKKTKEDLKLKRLKIRQTKQRDNLMKEVFIENVSSEQFNKIDALFYDLYPDLVKLHSLTHLFKKVSEYQGGLL